MIGPVPSRWTRPGKRPFRVVVVEPDLEENGSIRVDLDRVRRWQATGAEVAVVVLERKDETPWVPVPPGLDIRFASRRPRRFRYVYALGLAKVWWLARRSDVVVSGREVQNGLLLAAAAARWSRRPLAVTMHAWVERALTEHIEERFHAATRQALRRADLVVCVSADLTQAAEQVGVASERIRAVSNGIDAAEVQRQAALVPEVALPDGPLLVGCGRLNEQKGFDLLVRAHARALALGAPAHSVVVVGDGPDRGDLQRLAEAEGVAATFTFPGFASNSSAVIGRADLFVFPSRYEGFGMALVEALCLGVPVASARCPSGPEEILEGGRFGALFPVEDVEALARIICGHLQAPEDLRLRAHRGAAVVGERFSAAAAAQRHLDLLRGLAPPRRPSPWARLRGRPSLAGPGTTGPGDEPSPWRPDPARGRMRGA